LKVVNKQAIMTEKRIENIIGDFDTFINPLGEMRRIEVVGESGARYDLEVTDEDGKYYDFSTNLFRTSSSATTKLKDRMINEEGNDIVNVVFPAPSKLITYTVKLIANHSCGIVNVGDYNAVKRIDGTIYHNKSTGGVGGIIEKKLFGFTGLPFTLSCISPTLSDSGEVFETSTPRYGNDTGAQTRSSCYAGEEFKLDFSITLTATSGKSIRVTGTPTVDDLCAVKLINIGATPDTVDGLTNSELYPSVTSTDTTNGVVSSATDVTMDTAVTSKMRVGDRVTGTGISSTATVTVASFVSTFVFRCSEAVSVADGVTLSFSKAKHVKWPVSNVVGLKEGMLIDPSSTTGGNFQSNSRISGYTKIKTTEIVQPQDCDIPVRGPKRIREVLASCSAITDGSTIVCSEENIAGYPNTVSENNGSLSFSPAQDLTIASDSNVKVYAYGYDQIKAMTNMEVALSDVKITPTTITTTISDASATGSASLNDFDVASVTGIMDDVSIVSGAGIDVSTSEPRVTTISSSNLTLTPGGHTVTNGETLTFTGASNIVTITGIIHVKNFRSAADRTLYFDVERFLHSA
tara:strand:+ start:13033 stop:14760 length:1728 start_codon:yes stop_codon:yes gene_type:complete